MFKNTIFAAILLGVSVSVAAQEKLKKRMLHRLKSPETL